jgi:hypothetical protein
LLGRERDRFDDFRVFAAAGARIFRVLHLLFSTVELIRC